MARQILFVQGGGAGTHDSWDNKLVDSLRHALGPDYEIRYPRMPREDDPNYIAWSAAISAEIEAFADGALLVGHSIGATILINFLASKPAPRKFGGLFLVAPPFIGEGGWPGDEIAPMADIGQRLTIAAPIYIYHGSNDDTVPRAHIDLYAKALPQAIVRRLASRDHQLNDDLTEVASDIRALAR